MPIYEYRCKKCGNEFEALVSQDRKAKCMKCGSTRLEKLLSTFSANTQPTKLPCDSGTCSSGACPTGSCPFSE